LKSLPPAAGNIIRRNPQYLEKEEPQRRPGEEGSPKFTRGKGKSSPPKERGKENVKGGLKTQKKKQNFLVGGFETRNSEAMERRKGSMLTMHQKTIRFCMGKKLSISSARRTASSG